MARAWRFGVVAVLAALLVPDVLSAPVGQAFAAKNAPAIAEYGEDDGLVARTSVVLHKSQVMNFEESFDSAMVAESDIAEVVPITNRSLYVLGRNLGATRLVLIDANKDVVQIIEVTVTHDLDALREQLAANIDASDVRVSTVNESIMLSGRVRDSVDLDRAIMIAKQYSSGSVMNALSVGSIQQVMLEVRFLEASRVASRELGISTRVRSEDVNADTNDQGSLSSSGSLIVPQLLSGTQPFGSVLANLFDDGVDVDMLIRALEKRSLARRLAEPNLITTSGETASFLAGGEFPFPVSAGNDKITIQFKPFGVSLTFTPTVLAKGLINLKIEPEVSELDPLSSIEVSGTQIPGLVVRRARTTVELNEGQSLAIAGLLQNNNVRTQSQLPWLGSVPVLGALFRSSDFQNKETDLVIIVTPHLIKPKVPGEVLASPLDSHQPGNDVDFFVNGRSEVQRTARAEDRSRREQVGHIIELADEVAYVPAD